MMTLILIATLLAVSLTCAFLGVRLRSWTVALAAVLAAFGLLTPISTLSLVLCGVILAIVLVPLNVAPWRKQFISAPFLAEYKRMLPSLSQTEADALEAGTVGWEGQLFSGKPDWQVLRNMPLRYLTKPEQAFIDGPVEELCGMLDEWDINHKQADLPPEIWDFLKRNRFFGMIIPEAYGGLGFSALAHRAVLQKVSSMSAVAGTTVAVPNSLGPGELILHYGTEEQKEHYLPRLAAGDEIPCFALTGPTAGSDATSLHAIRVHAAPHCLAWRNRRARRSSAPGKRSPPTVSSSTATATSSNCSALPSVRPFIAFASRTSFCMRAALWSLTLLRASWANPLRFTRRILLRARLFGFRSHPMAFAGSTRTPPWRRWSSRKKTRFKKMHPCTSVATSTISGPARRQRSSSRETQADISSPSRN